MKFYIAASYSNKIHARFLRGKLIERGDTVISTWHDDWENLVDDPKRWIEDSLLDMRQVKACDGLVLLTGDTKSCGGKHTELGLALAWRKKITLIGPREQVFHAHPMIVRYENVRDFIEGYGMSPSDVFTVFILFSNETDSPEMWFPTWDAAHHYWEGVHECDAEDGDCANDPDIREMTKTRANIEETYVCFTDEEKKSVEDRGYTRKENP